MKIISFKEYVTRNIDESFEQVITSELIISNNHQYKIINDISENTFMLIHDEYDYWNVTSTFNPQVTSYFIENFISLVKPMGISANKQIIYEKPILH